MSPLPSTESEGPARSPGPGWWFAALWVAAFVLPVAVQGAMAQLWRQGGAANVIGLPWATVFVLISAAGTGLLIRRYVPRPIFWIIGPIIGWAALVWFGGDYGWFILSWFTGPLGFPIVVLVAALLAGAIQSCAFTLAGEVWPPGPRARRWVAYSALTCVAMFTSPFVAGMFPADWGKPFEASFYAWLLVASSGGVVSCAGILRILHAVPESPGAGRADEPH